MTRKQAQTEQETTLGKGTDESPTPTGLRHCAMPGHKPRGCGRRSAPHSHSPGSIQKVIPIISLMRFVTQIFNQPVHVRHRHSKSCAGLGHDIFFNHDTTQIIRAKF